MANLSYALLFCILFFIFSNFSFLTAQFTSRDQRVALIRLRSSLGLKSKDWGIKSDPCSKWVGIRCFNGSVTEINISGFKRTRIGKQNPQFSVQTLANFTELSVFNASFFDLPGKIPDWFGDKLVKLQVLDLRACSIYGSIPVNFGNLTNLAGLYLSGNRLTGMIPATLGQIHSLSVLDLADNSLTDKIPASFGSLLNLSFLDLSSNFISGSIPEEIGALNNLQKLNLSNNSLSSSIPNVLWSMNSLGFLDLSNNNFSGSLPNPIPNPRSNNSAAVFNFSHNLLYGSLTSLVTRFEFVDLSSNYFQGDIPYRVTTNVSLDTNCLRNSSNQRSSADCLSFYTNRGLGFDYIGILSPPPSHQSRKRKNGKISLYILGGFCGLIFLILFLATLLVSVVLCCRRKKRVNQRSTNVGPVSTDGASPSQPPSAQPYHLSFGESFTLKQIVEATGNFCNENFIKQGRTGDFFRGLLSGMPSVVKRINLNFVKREFYLTELQFLSKISHPRLVPFFGHCGEKEDEKFLVYKYMPNGDLSSSLFWKDYRDEEDQLRSLDWITRLKIATGAAEGLSYLHHECNPPLVHRDVQASSILLDDKFEVRLGSLSEICPQDNDLHQSLIARFMRLPTASDQGSSGTHTAMCTYDVYCFGKVLLELVTGKLGCTKEWIDETIKCISAYDKELMTHIVDPTLIVDDDLMEEVWAMAVVARSCLNPKPLRRPLMKYVFKALENPVRVVRPDIAPPARVRETSFRNSWTTSWRQNGDAGE